MMEHSERYEYLIELLEGALEADQRVQQLVEEAERPLAERTQPTEHLTLRLQACRDEYTEHLDRLLEADHDSCLASLSIPEQMKRDIRNRWVERDVAERFERIEEVGRFERIEEYERNAERKADEALAALMDRLIPGQREQREREEHQRYLEMQNRPGPDDHPDPDYALRFIYEK